MWLFILAVGVLAFVVSTALSSPDKLTMSNFLEVLRQNALYNACGIKANWDDIFKRGRNKFALPEPKTGRVAVITGGARGIGLEVVKSLLLCEFHIVMGCRKVSAAEEAVAELRKEGVTSGTVQVLELDVGSLASVRGFAARVLEACPKIHLLLNNAGIMLVPFALTEDGHESQFGVNYLGHALLTHLLLPRLEASGAGGDQARVVSISSCAHFSAGTIDFEDLEMKKNYVSSAAYARSKLAQIMFTQHVQRLLDARGAPVQMFAVHPGVVDTELFNGTYIKRFFPWMPKLMFKSAAQGAISVAYACLAPELESRGGAYISNCGEESSSSVARDHQQQERLFKETCTMLNIEHFGQAS